MKILLTVVFCLLAAASHARADHEIFIHLSYKVIISPSGGGRPPGVTDSVIDSAIDEMNQLMVSQGRGYRFVRIDPVIDVGGTFSFGIASRPSPSRYYGINMLNPSFSNARQQMEDDALDNQSLYAWNPNAINIYINQANAGGQCAFPANQLIAVGAGSADNGALQLHEIGHYFGLCHTQGCPCGCCGAFGATGECNTEPGDDGISDTLPDLACWDRDDIAMHSFGVAYSQLAEFAQRRVDDVFLNIMSYHRGGCGHSGGGATTERLTERQLDQWSDAAFATRRGVCDGRTYFVQAGAFLPIATGRPDRPFPTVGGGLGAATSPTDIVMIRGGTYPETLRLSTPVTLRTPRGNVARIGQ